MSESVHGTVVLLGAAGVLIRGESGMGKSTLALALIERGGRLVADDRPTLTVCHGRLVATAPFAIRGLVELRGRGLIEVPHERSAVVRLVADIVEAEALERAPEQPQLTTTVLGVALPRQPVPDATDRAVRLIGAALRAEFAAGDSGADSGLRSAPLWG